MTAEVVVKAAPPAGPRFKGNRHILVRELVISAEAVRDRRQRWLTPSGETVLAPLRRASSAASGRGCAASFSWRMRSCPLTWCKRRRAEPLASRSARLAASRRSSPIFGMLGLRNL